MNLTKVIDEAKQKTGLNQDQLAERIGLDRTALSHVLHGRRKLKAEAAIELWAITGIDPREILKATVTKKPAGKAGLQAACIALAAVSLFMSSAETRASASSPYAPVVSHNTYSRCFLRRILDAIQHLMRTPRSPRILRAA